MNNTTTISPILLIIFNRPEKTKYVFEAIKSVKPAILYIAADGPRTNKIGEKELCESTRKITELIDWPCRVERLYQEKNLGCKIGVSTAITWFFSHVEEGIILEDDCLPNFSFFTFCSTMLKRYRSDNLVMAVNGTNSLTKQELGEQISTFHFSRCLQIWGWATWKRAWIENKLEMEGLNLFKHVDFANTLFIRKKYIDFLIKHFKHIRDKKIDTWDAQWYYSILKNNGVVISPHVNMIENIGFDYDATHTTYGKPDTIPTEELPTLMVSPVEIVVDKVLDAKLMEKMYVKNIWQRIISRMRG
jgi:hypothetical protein